MAKRRKNGNWVKELNNWTIGHEQRADGQMVMCDQLFTNAPIEPTRPGPNRSEPIRFSRDPTNPIGSTPTQPDGLGPGLSPISRGLSPLISPHQPTSGWAYAQPQAHWAWVASPPHGPAHTGLVRTWTHGHRSGPVQTRVRVQLPLPPPSFSPAPI